VGAKTGYLAAAGSFKPDYGTGCKSKAEADDNIKFSQH
jgi:hypothetical protein